MLSAIAFNGGQSGTSLSRWTGKNCPCSVGGSQCTRRWRRRSGRLDGELCRQHSTDEVGWLKHISRRINRSNLLDGCRRVWNSWLTFKLIFLIAVARAVRIPSRRRRNGSRDGRPEFGLELELSRVDWGLDGPVRIRLEQWQLWRLAGHRCNASGNVRRSLSLWAVLSARC